MYTGGVLSTRTPQGDEGENSNWELLGTVSVDDEMANVSELQNMQVGTTQPCVCGFGGHGTKPFECGLNHAPWNVGLEEIDRRAGRGKVPRHW